jgi:hypothetical protein
MFGSDFAAADDADIVAAIAECTEAEAAIAARRLSAIAELAARYTEPDGEQEYLIIDGWHRAAAEISAAMGAGRHAASREMCIGMALRERLPKVAALFSEGRLSAKLVSVITWRTQLVVDSAIAERLDTAIAERAVKWGALSAAKLEKAIDSLVDTHDPDARRRIREAARSRDVQFGKPDDETGTASFWGRLSVTDAELLKRRLAHVTQDLCADDPRTAGQRRADALGAIAAFADRLTCRCGSPDCPSAKDDDPRASSFVINVIAEEAALDAEPDPQMSGDGETPPKPVTKSETKPKPTSTAALIVGGDVIPTPLLAELIKNGATVHNIQKPGPTPDNSYRPSRKVARFVRMRDMTCRFPGCDRPAEFCDIDHTTPYPAGATHPSNNKCLCRFHHLVKTFCGWLDEQRPDGTVIWTAPTGRTYVTHPGSRMFFPEWDCTTASLPATQRPPDSVDRNAMMPRRRRTRAADTMRRIMAERRLNREIAESARRNRPPPM